MAEHVQAALDQMVAPLADLQQRGVFDGAEIQAIVARRRESEYLLRRRNPRKADFLRYIQAEGNLEKLRQLRVKRLQREQQRQASNQQQQQTKHIGDKHIVQLIHLLWTRTLRKYGRIDPELYLEYAEFCKHSKSLKKLAVCYTQAMQYHPSKAVFWIEAASHEFFDNSSMQNARIILQRGLRINNDASSSPAAEDLWLQSFVLELHFVQKLRGRRAVLLGSGEQGNDNKEGDDEDIVKARTTTEENSRHKIALLVYDNAIQSKADSVEFRLKFLDQCSMFPETTDIKDHIIASIERDYGESETAWIARALYYQTKKPSGAANTTAAAKEKSGEKEPQTKRRRTAGDEIMPAYSDAVLDTIREACQKLRTEEMFLQALHFLDAYATESGADGIDTDDEGSVFEKRHEAAIRLIRELLEDASNSDFYSPKLAIRYVNFLTENANDIDGAIAVLKDYCAKSNDGKVSADVWIRWAGLVLERENEEEAVQSACRILEKAAKMIPMHQSDYMVVLLQLFGGKLVAASHEAADSEKSSLSELFQRILLLAPGFLKLKDIEDPAFDSVKNVPAACLQYLLSMLDTGDASDFRKVYDAVLYKSTLVDQLTAMDSEVMQTFIDKSIAAEYEQSNKKGSKLNHRECRKRLSRLYETATQMFRNTPLAAMYRQRRNEDVVYGFRPASAVKQAPVTAINSVPSIDVASADFDFATLERAYEEFQVVHLRNASKTQSGNCKKKLGWKDIGSIFQRLNDKDKESWCIETKAGATCLSASQFLTAQLTKDRAYCSFLIQHDADAHDEIISRLPFLEFRGSTWKYEPALWIFFGRNPLGNANLDGRPEHTDSVSHTGTWHYQLSGIKKWFLRPTSELVSHWKERFPAIIQDDKQFEVSCTEGDVIVVNTRLWFHRTVIPPQNHPSVSYARDFYRKGLTSGNKSEGGLGMRNVDGLFATSDIESGTIILTETDMPNCELHRSSNANCEVVELENGKSAVVSSRMIAAGEFFSVPDSEEDD